MRTVPRSYLLAFQNPAEARGTGGLVGGYGVLTADHGKLSVETLGTDSDLTGLKTVPTELGPDYVAMWGQDPALWVNSNESPHFPYGAQIWLDAWKAQHGQRLDGVLALDPEVLSYLLTVTGPVTLPDGERITAGNVVQQTMQTAYVRFAKNPNARKAYLTVVAGAVVQRLMGQRDDPAALVRALGRGVAERRVLVYSDHAKEQRALAGQPLAGALPDAQGANVLVAVNNAAGNKLDYYLDRRIRYAGAACTVGGMRATQVDLTLTNTVAKAADLPDYVVGVLGSQAKTPARRNDNKTIAGFWLPPGAHVQQVTVDSRPVEFNLGTEVGHPVVLTTVTLAPGRPVTVSRPAPRASDRHRAEPRRAAAGTPGSGRSHGANLSLRATVRAAACRYRGKHWASAWARHRKGVTLMQLRRLAVAALAAGISLIGFAVPAGAATYPPGAPTQQKTVAPGVVYGGSTAGATAIDTCLRLDVGPDRRGRAFHDQGLWLDPRNGRHRLGHGSERESCEVDTIPADGDGAVTAGPLRLSAPGSYHLHVQGPARHASRVWVSAESAVAASPASRRPRSARGGHAYRAR